MKSIFQSGNYLSQLLILFETTLSKSFINLQIFTSILTNYSNRQESIYCDSLLQTKSIPQPMSLLPSDIKTTLQQLCQNQQFLSNISFYTKSAIDCLLTPYIAQASQTQCPTPLLFAIAHYVSSGIPLQNLSIELPQNVREQFVKAVRVLEKKVNSVPQENATLRLLNDHVGNLKDVTWQMAIENGREVWIVQLIIDSLQAPVVMKLNYQELSLLCFKINQVVGHVKSLDINKIV